MGIDKSESRSTNPFVQALEILSVILVVVDRSTKATHFDTLPTFFNATEVAELFVNMICKLHGQLFSILSDIEPIFITHFD